MKANSGIWPSGHCSTRALLTMYSAEETVIMKGKSEEIGQFDNLQMDNRNR
jgi:hypothetical protein